MAMSEPPDCGCGMGDECQADDYLRDADLNTPLGGVMSAMTLTEEEWQDLAGIARSYVALCRQQMAAPGRYTDLDLHTQHRRRVLAERVIEAAKVADQ